MREEVFHQLARELKPFKPLELLPRFLTKRLLPIFVLFFILSVAMFRNNQVLASRWELWDFHLQNLIWALVSLGSFIAFYNSAFPEKRVRLTENFVWLGLALLVGVEIWRLDFTHLGSQFLLEMDVWRGGCGVLISLMSMGYWYLLQRFAAKAAPRSVTRTGLWASLSAGSVGCLLMQSVCFQEGTFHILLWHFLPLALACYFGPIAAKKWMRW